MYKYKAGGIDDEEGTEMDDVIDEILRRKALAEEGIKIQNKASTLLNNPFRSIIKICTTLKKNPKYTIIGIFIFFLIITSIYFAIMNKKKNDNKNNKKNNNQTNTSV